MKQKRRVNSDGEEEGETKQIKEKAEEQEEACESEREREILEDPRYINLNLVL